MVRTIHFRETDKRRQAANYALVQKTLIASISQHLQPHEFTKGRGLRSGALSFSLFIGRKADVMMSHGVADKNYLLRLSPHKNFLLRRFKHLFVPGEWMKRRIMAHPKVGFKGQIHTVGWPRLDYLLAKQAEHIATPSKRPRVLWAPTHNSRRYGPDRLPLSTYPEFQAYLPELEKTCDVSVSLHPTNRVDKKPTSEKLIECDFVISDFGTMVYEAWALGKPVIFPSWIVGERMLEFLWKESAEYHIYSQRLGLHANSFQEMLDFIHGSAGLDERVLEFREDYLEPKYKGQSGKRIADLLRELAIAAGPAPVGSAAIDDDAAAEEDDDEADE